MQCTGGFIFRLMENGRWYVIKLASPVLGIFGTRAGKGSEAARGVSQALISQNIKVLRDARELMSLVRNAA